MVAAMRKGVSAMTSLKKAVYGTGAALLSMPAMAGAQFTKPTDTGLPGDGGSAAKGFVDILTSIMKWLLTIVGILAVIAFVISGILYLTSAGDEDQIGRAKKAMIYAIVGVIVSLLGMIVLNAVEKMLQGESDF